MSTFYNAFDHSPVPPPGPDAQAPAIFRGIYGMPMFVSVPTPDLEASVDFWTRALGFIDLFSVPGQFTHLRRWAFQDVLLVPRSSTAAVGDAAVSPAQLTVSFAAVRSQLEGIRQDCERLLPGSASELLERPWNSTEVEIMTPEGVLIIMTAANPLPVDGPASQALRDMGMNIDIIDEQKS